MATDIDTKKQSLTEMNGAAGDGNAEDSHASGVVSYSPENPDQASTNKASSQDGTPAKGKKKWSLFGVFKKKDKTDGGKADSKHEEKLTAQKSSSNVKDANKTDAVPSTPRAQKEEPVEEKKEEKKVVQVTCLADLPEDCQKLIKQSGLPTEKLEANFRILLRVLHFRTGVIYRLPEDMDTPAHPQPPKSNRFKPGSEYVVELGELKKVYKEIDEVGKGGFGTVFHARSVKEKGKLVAIKKMPHATRKQRNNNFQEVSVLSALNHPNIVKFNTCYEVKDELWIAMEYLEGGTFEEAAKAWNFNEANLAYVARELLKGISYLHANQLAHRDLKSANIMMSIQGQVKLIDFGLCADMSTGFPRHMVGSPFWMPPEMIQGIPHTYAVDIWSFAISLLEMANQRPPMIESAVKAMFTVATEGCPQLFVDPSKWSATFKEFLGLCLKVDPEERATAEQLLKHPFIQLADTRTNMEHILRRIFLSNSLLNSGF